MSDGGKQKAEHQEGSLSFKLHSVVTLIVDVLKGVAYIKVTISVIRLLSQHTL